MVSTTSGRSRCPEPRGIRLLNDIRAEIVPLIPRLRRYARALTGGRESADDLVQDSLERALRKSHLWRRGSDLRAWLFTIMHNVFLNQVRARAPICEELDAAESVHATARGPQDLAAVLDLETALRRLPEEQRAVLLLVGLEEMTYEETANVLNLPIGTVMSRLSRARERLRRLLAGESAEYPVRLTVVK